MVLQSQRCPGAAFQHHPGAATYQQQSYSTYQKSSERIQNGGHNNFSAITGYTTPYSNYSQVSTYSSENPQHHQSGATHYSGGGVVTTGLPNGSSYHGHNSCFKKVCNHHLLISIFRILNGNIAKLQPGYLFPEIGRRKSAHMLKYPDAQVMCSITEPIPDVITSAMAKRALALSTVEGYDGYGAEQGEKV